MSECYDYRIGGQPGRCARCDAPIWDHPRPADRSCRVDRPAVVASHRRAKRRAGEDGVFAAVDALTKLAVGAACALLGFGAVWLSTALESSQRPSADVAAYSGSMAAASKIAAALDALHGPAPVMPGGGGGAAP